MTSLDDRLTERDAQLTRFAKRHPKAASAVVNALAKVRYLQGEPSEYTCACGSPAAEWQLTFFENVEGPAFLAYSDDVHDYAAQCTPCELDTHTFRLRALNAWRLSGGN